MCVSMEYAEMYEYQYQFYVGKIYAEALVDSEGQALHIDEDGKPYNDEKLIIGNTGHPVYVQASDFVLAPISSKQLKEDYGKDDVD